MTGTKQIVYLYEGVIPKSGKSVIEFGGIKCCHRSIKKDKCDLLVHVDSGIIIRSFPISTQRSQILDDMANHVDKLKHFISHPEAYLIRERPTIQREQERHAEKSGGITMTHYSDGSEVKPSKWKQEFKLPLRKTINLKDATW